MEVAIKSDDGYYLRATGNPANPYDWKASIDDATVFSLDIQLDMKTSRMIVTCTPPLPFEPVDEFHLAYLKKWAPRFVPVFNAGYRELTGQLDRN